VSAGPGGFIPLFLETCGVSVARVLPNLQKIKKIGCLSETLLQQGLQTTRGLKALILQDFCPL